jgi:hypothetical protein
MEDIGGVALKSVIPKGGFAVDEFLELACSAGIFFISLFLTLPQIPCPSWRGIFY